jgi:3-isopropylmalate/(R)-2-methylmalate dehydratase small subunit
MKNEAYMQYAAVTMDAHIAASGLFTKPLPTGTKMKSFNGKVLFLDRSDINTDEIIPAKYLTEISREALAPHLLEDLKLEEFDPATDIAGKRVVVTRANFGCGSSREHAPWALEVNGINLVVAESFARIFRQNMFNCGMMAVELPADAIDRLFVTFAGHDTRAETDIDSGTITFTAKDQRTVIPFTTSGFDANLVAAGGWMEFADRNY